MEITANTSGSASARTLTWTAGDNSLAITTDAHTSATAAAQLDDIRDKLDLSTLKGFSFTFLDTDGVVIDSTNGDNWRDTASITTNAGGDIAKIIVSRDDNIDFNLFPVVQLLFSSVDGVQTLRQ